MEPKIEAWLCFWCTSTNDDHKITRIFLKSPWSTALAAAPRYPKPHCQSENTKDDWHAWEDLKHSLYMRRVFGCLPLLSSPHIWRLSLPTCNYLWYQKRNRISNLIRDVGKEYKISLSLSRSLPAPNPASIITPRLTRYLTIEFPPTIIIAKELRSMQHLIQFIHWEKEGKWGDLRHR